MNRSPWSLALVIVVVLVIAGLFGGMAAWGQPVAQTPRITPTFTPTEGLPTDTPTSTSVPPTNTSVPPTNTSTSTSVPPTNIPTSVPPTPTTKPVEPTNTRASQPPAAAPSTASAHLSLGLTADPTAPTPQGKVLCTIRVTNDGNASADGVVVTCNVPTGLAMLGATVTQGTATVNGNQVSAQLGSLAAGQSTTVTIQTQLQASVGAGVPLSLTASATANGGLSAISSPVVVQIPSMPNTGVGLTVFLLVAGLVLAAIILVARGFQIRRTMR